MILLRTSDSIWPNKPVQRIAGPSVVSMNTDLTFHRSGTGPAGRRAGRVPSFPTLAIHPSRRPAIRWTGDVRRQYERLESHRILCNQASCELLLRRRSPDRCGFLCGDEAHASHRRRLPCQRIYNNEGKVRGSFIGNGTWWFLRIRRHLLQEICIACRDYDFTPSTPEEIKLVTIPTTARLPRTAR